MKNLLPVLLGGLLANAALTYAGTGAATITLSGTPAAVSCNATSWVNSVVVSVVPGGEGKVYIGQSSQNPGTGAGIAQILFPNAGAHSEQFELADPSGNDTINLCNLYVAGEISGETALASWKYKNGTSTGNELALVQAQAYTGPVPSSAPIGCAGAAGPFVPFASSGLLRDSTLSDTDPSYYFDKIRVQVIPGRKAKSIWLGAMESPAIIFTFYIRIVAPFISTVHGRKAGHCRTPAGRMDYRCMTAPSQARHSTDGASSLILARRGCRWDFGNCKRIARWWIRPTSTRSREPTAFLPPR